MKYLTSLMICCGLMWQGCKTFNAADPVPTYIHIDSFHFEQSSLQSYILSNNNVQSLAGGTLPLTHQTNVAWVYYNNDPVGIFDLPATFPITTNTEGTGVLEVSPGIIADGENNDVVNYTFYTVGTYTFAAQPGKTINYTPNITYSAGDKVLIIDNFENNARSNFAPVAGSAGFMGVEDSIVYYGKNAGIISLTAPNVDSSTDSNIYSFQIPSGMAYIEFDYNSTVPFYVGLQGNLSNFISSTPTYLTGIYPNAGWQKFYLEVDGFTATAQATSYNFYIKAVLAPNQKAGRLLISNIQLVTN